MNDHSPIGRLISVVCIPGINTNANSWPLRYETFVAPRYPRLFVTSAPIQNVTGVQMYLAEVIPFLEWGRRRAIAGVLKESARSGEELNIMAHSKGTDWAVDTLWAYPTIHVHALVLIGSILTERYHGSKLDRIVQRGQVDRVLNVWSPNDDTIRLLSFWPAGGKLGCRGFIDLPRGYDPERTGPPVWQLQTEEDHSTYFWREFRESYFEIVTRFMTCARPSEIEELRG